MTAQIPHQLTTSEHSVAPDAPVSGTSARRHDEPDDSGGRGWVIVASAAAVIGLGALGALVISATTGTADDPSQVRAAAESADAVEANRVDLIEDLAAGSGRSSDVVEANRVDLIEDLAGASTGTGTVSASSGTLVQQAIDEALAAARESNEGPNEGLAPDPLAVPHVLVNRSSAVQVNEAISQALAEHRAADAERQAIIDKLSSL